MQAEMKIRIYNSDEGQSPIIHTKDSPILIVSNISGSPGFVRLTNKEQFIDVSRHELAKALKAIDAVINQ